MAFLTLDEAKQHLKVDTSVEDDYINALILVAVAAAESHLNRKLYQNESSFNADSKKPSTAMIIKDDIKHALKLLVGHYYTNREPITDGNIKTVPYTLRFLLEPHRAIP